LFDKIMAEFLNVGKSIREFKNETPKPVFNDA
jgi:hypothetical protein